MPVGKHDDGLQLLSVNGNSEATPNNQGNSKGTTSSEVLQVAGIDNVQELVQRALVEGHSQDGNHLAEHYGIESDVVEEELVGIGGEGTVATQEDEHVEQALVMLQPFVALFDRVKNQADAVSEVGQLPIPSNIQASGFGPQSGVANSKKRTANQAFQRTLSDSPPHKIVALSRNDIPTESILQQYSEIYRESQLLANRDVEQEQEYQNLINDLKAVSLREAQLQSTVHKLQARIEKKDADIEEHQREDQSMKGRIQSLHSLRLELDAKIHERDVQIQNDVFQYNDIKTRMELLEGKHCESMAALCARVEEKEVVIASQVVTIKDIEGVNGSLHSTIQMLQAELRKRNDDNETLRNDLDNMRAANEALCLNHAEHISKERAEWQTKMDELAKSFNLQMETSKQEFATCQDKLKSERNQLVGGYNNLKERLSTLENSAGKAQTRPVTQKEWNCAFEIVRPKVWEAMLKLRNELSSKLSIAQGNVNKMRKHIRALESQRITEHRQVRGSMIEPNIKPEESAGQHQDRQLWFLLPHSNHNTFTTNSSGSLQDAGFSFRMNMHRDNSDSISSRTCEHPTTDVPKGYIQPPQPIIGAETCTTSLPQLVSRHSAPSSNSSPPGVMSEVTFNSASHEGSCGVSYPTLVTDREGPETTGSSRMKFNKNSFTARNFCAKEWCEAHRGGTVAEFRHYWESLSSVERGKYAAIAQGAKDAQSNVPQA